MPIRRRQKKRNDEPRQKQKQRHAVIDPLVDPGNPPYRHQTRSKADPTRTHHRLVTVAQSSPSSRSALSPQKTATVMLDRATRRKSLVVRELCDNYVAAAERGLIMGKRQLPKKQSTLYSDHG